MSALFKEGYWLAGSALIVLLAGVLIGILYHGMRMLCDNPKCTQPQDLLGPTDTIVLSVLLLFTCVVGAAWENIPWLNNLLNSAVRIIGG